MSTPGAFVVSRDSENGKDIFFQVLDTITDVPEEQQTLRDNVDAALTVLRELFARGGPKFEEYFRALLSLAQLGLAGPNAQPGVASRALTSFRRQVVALEGGRIRNRYLQWLALWGAVLAIPAAGLALLGERWFPIPDAAKPYLLMWTGAMVGVWLSFGTRRLKLDYDELPRLDEDRLLPVIRLALTGALALTVCLLFMTGVVSVAIGGRSSTEVGSDWGLALLAGILLGFAEKLLPAAIQKRASALVDW